MECLKDILFAKKKEIKSQAGRFNPVNMQKPRRLLDKQAFIKNIKRNRVNIVAEIKKASPSMGIINEKLDIGRVSALYASYRSFISAVSVITEPIYFKGRNEYIGEVKNFSNLPVLRKDFIFHRDQVYESLNLGADCILLISSIVGQKKLRYLYELAKSIGLDVLVEIHSKRDFEKALGIGAEIIGINNRNLKDMSVNIKNTLEILQYAEEKDILKEIKDKILIAESGINGNDIDYIENLYHRGINTFLVGSYFMQTKNLALSLKEMERKLREKKLI